MKVKLIFIGLLISLSTLIFGVANTVNAESITVNSNVQQITGEIRVEFVLVNGILWKIVYDSDENIIQASAVGHAE